MILAVSWMWIAEVQNLDKSFMVIQKYMKSRTLFSLKNFRLYIWYILTALLESIKQNALMLC